MTSRIQPGLSVLALALSTVLLFGTAGAAPNPTAQEIAGLVQASSPAVDVSVFATGLYNPRGLKFGPDGNLYVAEGGKGGTQSTSGQCEQVIAPVGPYLGSSVGGRISRIDSHGVRTTVTTDLPSSTTSPDLGSLISGVADVAFIGTRMYALITGAGCSHGVSGRDNAVVRIRSDGSPVLVANLSAYQKTHPVANPQPSDFEPDGTWWNMVALGGALFAVEPNHGEVVKVTLDGHVSRLVDVSASRGHVVPTALAYDGGYLYLSQLGTFPIVDGSQRVWRLHPSGQLSTVVRGVTTVLGLAFDHDHNMYILQNTTGLPGPAPDAGSILRVRPGGTPETIVTGLSLPTGMTFGPDGDLYVSNLGFGAPPIGLGQVLRIHIAH